MCLGFTHLTVEILSPDQNATKVISNILHCLKYGTQLGWFIDRGAISVLPSRAATSELTGMTDCLHPNSRTGSDSSVGVWLVEGRKLRGSGVRG